MVLLVMALVDIATAQATKGNAITSASEAIQRCEVFTQMSRFFESKAAAQDAAMVEAVEYVDTLTPYLHETLNGRRAWKIVYADFNLAVDTANRSRYVCTFWIDSLTGQFLFGDIRRTTDSVVSYRMPTAEESDEQLGRSGERYHELPSDTPIVSLADVLVKFFGPGLYGKQVIVRYVMYSCWSEAYEEILQVVTTAKEEAKFPPNVSKEPYPAWEIYVRGAYPWSFNTTENPTRGVARTRRQVINALTGIAGPLTNKPYPESDKW